LDNFIDMNLIDSDDSNDYSDSDLSDDSNDEYRENDNY
jgi:hypothetical protein